jgi:hypothetical protein
VLPLPGHSRGQERGCTASNGRRAIVCPCLLGLRSASKSTASRALRPLRTAFRVVIHAPSRLDSISLRHVPNPHPALWKLKCYLGSILLQNFLSPKPASDKERSRHSPAQPLSGHSRGQEQSHSKQRLRFEIETEQRPIACMPPSHLDISRIFAKFQTSIASAPGLATPYESMQKSYVQSLKLIGPCYLGSILLQNFLSPKPASDKERSRHSPAQPLSGHSRGQEQSHSKQRLRFEIE